MKWRASEMVFLPIVARELRVAARRPRTYYGRMIAAAVWMLAAANVVMISASTGIGKRAGLSLFSTVGGALFVWCVLSAWAGADSISVEKREGTIGFLFLTDLKSHDIVLGKMAGAALPAFYAGVAALPLMAICMLMGGVTPAQYVKAGLALLNIFFLGQAVGVFSSALCRVRGNSMGVPLLILVSYLALFALTAMAEDLKGWAWAPLVFQLNNPARPLYLSWVASFARSTMPGYWITLLVVHLHAWIFLALAVWVLPRRWRDKPKQPSLWARTWERWRYGSMAARTAFRRRLVSVNPILWLVCRGRFSPAFAWSVMGAGVAVTGWMAGEKIVGDGWAWSYADCLPPVIIALQLMLRMGVPAHAALLEEHRRNGSLEIMLCCSPMSVDDILEGMWLVVRRYYRWPVMVLLVVQGLMFLAAWITGLRHSMHINLLCFIFVSSILLIPDLRAMGWMAMLAAMSNPRPRSASSSAFFWICLFPWTLISACYAVGLCRSELWLWVLWPTFALVNDTIVGRLAQDRLRKNFRLWAAPAYAAPKGFWIRVGRLLGGLRRRCRLGASLLL